MSHLDFWRLCTHACGHWAMKPPSLKKLALHRALLAGLWMYIGLLHGPCFQVDIASEMKTLSVISKAFLQNAGSRPALLYGTMTISEGILCYCKDKVTGLPHVWPLLLCWLKFVPLYFSGNCSCIMYALLSGVLNLWVHSVPNICIGMLFVPPLLAPFSPTTACTTGFLFKLASRRSSVGLGIIWNPCVCLVRTCSCQGLQCHDFLVFCLLTHMQPLLFPNGGDRKPRCLHFSLFCLLTLGTHFSLFCWLTLGTILGPIEGMFADYT